MRENAERLDLALRATGLGTWEMDLVNDRRTWSDQTLAMHGLTRNQSGNGHVPLNNMLMNPEDQARQKALHAELKAGRDDYAFQYRATVDDRERWISAWGKVLERTKEGPTRIVGVCADITEQREAEALRRASEERFRTLANAMPQLVWIADSDGNVTFYNDRREGYASLNGVAATDWQPIVHPDDMSETMSAWSRSMADGSDYEMEHRLRRSDGRYIWHLSRATSMRGPNGRVSAWFGTATDIDALKRSEMDLQAAEEHLRLATEAAEMFAWEVDFIGNSVRFAPNAAKVIGCDPIMLTTNLADGTFFVHDADRERIAEEFQHAIVNGASDFVLEFRGKPHDDGQPRYWRAAGKLIRGQDGTPLRAVAVTQDVSRYREAKAALVLSAERLAAAEEGAGALVYDWNKTTGEVWRSDSLTRLLGWERDELPATAEAWAALMHPADRARLIEMASETRFDADDRSVNEYRVRHKNGHYVWVLDAARAFRDATGGIIRIAGATIDVTARKRSDESQLRTASLVDLSFEPIFAWHPNDGIVEWNRGAEQLYGYTKAEALSRRSHDLLRTQHPLGMEQFMRQLHEEENWTGEVHHTAKDGSVITVESRQQLIELDGEEIVLETNRDIRDRKEWEERQRLMNRELAHRVKNSFAVLQAILRSTLKSAPDPAHFAQAFSGRLHSLSSAHDVLSANDWRGAELSALLRHQLSVYLSGQRITLTGLPVHLAAEHAAPISLIINELATNAVKHGALSVPQGMIAIAWKVKGHGAGDATLMLEWRERGGPPADRPGPPSFGTTLIQKSLAGAKVETRYERAGLVCNISWRFPKAQRKG